MNSDDTGFTAWNPGLSSRIPASLQSEVTLFRNENSSIDYPAAKELSDFCGLSAIELVSFRVERLVIHELLVRVTSDLFVPDGPNYEDLGISLRSMVAKIYDNYAVPEMSGMQMAFERELANANQFISTELATHVFKQNSVDQKKASLLDRLFKRTGKTESSSGFREPAEFVALSLWQKLLVEEQDSHKQACLKALVKTVDSIIGHRGRVVNQPELIATIATQIAANTIGSNLVSKMIDPVFLEAVSKERYELLPVQARSVVMNVKGASASGKSTIRSKQKELAAKLDVSWNEFAVISPDYWRKYLLDYDSLGEHYKYAAMLTGQELEIIDKKLDRYIEEKASCGSIPHLLIDRFRFDSFSVEKGRSQDSKLLSRFGDQIFLFFMVTSPSETVVRAWERGITTGRYKAVDDLLYHNIEAYTGMPALFYSWVLSNDKSIHFEFLNNDVTKGEVPKTIAFGRNNLMTIIDLQSMCNIDRFRKVNIEASASADVLIDDAKAGHEFLTRCIAEIGEVRLAHVTSGETYAVFRNGQLVWCNPQAVETLVAEVQSPEVQMWLSGLTEQLNDNSPMYEAVYDGEFVVKEKSYTIGR